MKLVRIAIFLTGITGLIMGGLTSISSLRTDQEQAGIRTNENLKSQATILVDQFFGTLESTKAFNQGNGVNSLPYLTHRAVLNLKQGAPSDFESFNAAEVTPSSPAVDLALEERVMNALKNQLSIGDLRITKVCMGTYDLNEGGSKEGIFIAQPVFKIVNGVADTSSIEKANIALIDPVKAFAGVQKLASGESTAFLLNKKGKVLAHTLNAYVGTDLRKISHLKDTIENLFLGTQTGSVDRYTNVDGTKSQVAFVRAGAYPFAFAVEQKATPAVLSSEWMSEQMESGAARKNLGFALVVIAIALITFTVVSTWAGRELNKQIEANREVRKENAVDLPMGIAPSMLAKKVAPSAMATAQAAVKAPITAQASIESAADSFVEFRAQLEQERDHSHQQARLITTDRDYVRELLGRIESSLTAEGIEKELTSLSSELTESPVLFLRYNRRNQNLTLASVAGEIRIPNYVQMQAYVRKDIELQVEQLAEGGKVASLTNYGPINKLMITHLNVAHFEAWGVTSSPEISGQARLVGVLVVLHAGMRSAQVRPTLAKILKESGNYLYAQNNKLKPKSKNVDPAISEMNFDSDLT
jgi:hypothetical protein